MDLRARLWLEFRLTTVSGRNVPFRLKAARTAWWASIDQFRRIVRAGIERLFFD